MQSTELQRTAVGVDARLLDFRNFLFLVWDHLRLPAPTDVQYDIAYYLQHGPKRSMIQAFRGVGKSYVTSAFVCWQLLLDPNLNILVVSASKSKADEFSIFTKRLIAEMPILEHLKPDPKRGHRDSNIAFDVGPSANSQTPSVKSVGITGQLTGSRADIIIADDIESLNNSLTQLGRDDLEVRIKEFAAILKPLTTARVIYLGTPQTEQSIYNRLPEAGYDIRIWPARVPADPDRYKGRLAPFVYAMIERGLPTHTPVDPARFNELELVDKEAEYRKAGFTLQFMLDTTLSDVERYPLKLSDMIVMPLDPRMGPAKLTWCNSHDQIVEINSVGLAGDRLYGPMWVSKEMTEFTGCVMTIDPSGRGKDETGYAIVKILHGMLYLVATGGFRDGYSEATLKALSVLAKTHAVNCIRIESNFGDGMFSQLLKPVMSRIHPCTIEEERSVGQKEVRILDVLEPVLQQHRLVVDTKVLREDQKTEDAKYQLFYQLTRLTREKGALAHDDRLDALAQAVGYWVEQMGRDTEKAADEHLDRLRELDLQNFMNGVLGTTRGSNLNWMDV